MKLLKHDNKLETNTKHESQDFGIGNASVVIEILRNRLYKHKVRTLVQEYISNGRDASREVNSTNPIQVTCPTMFEPTFKVRDFGPGISPDRMANVFVKYGASTKRDTNNQTGGFGIGAKSAWSYTDSFNIVTYIDGTKREYLAHTGVNNNGRLEFLGESLTNEPNGTEILIGVNPSDISQFKNAIERCLFFWNESEYKLTNMPETLLNDSFEHDCLGDIHLYKHLPDNISLGSYGWNRDIILCIDGIPYNIKDLKSRIDSLEKLDSLVVGTMVINIPNGLIEVSANREEVTDSDFTIKALTELCDKLLIKVDAHIKSLFKGIKTPKKYLETYLNNINFYGLNDYNTFKGYKFNARSLELINGESLKIYECFYQSDRFYKREVKSSWNNKQIKIDRLDHLFYHTGNLSLVKLGQKLRQKVKDSNAHTIILIESANVDTVFNDTIKDLNASDIDLVQLPDKPKVTRKQKRDSREICLHIPSYRRRTRHLRISDISDTWYYIEQSELTSLHVDIERYFDIQICGLSNTSIKAIKDNKHFKPLNDLIVNHKIKKSEVNSVLKKDTSNHQAISFLNKQNVNDTIIKKYLDKHNKIAKVDSINMPHFIIAKIENLNEVKEFKKQAITFDNHIEKNYMLLQTYINKENEKDLQIYFNAKQKELKNG